MYGSPGLYAVPGLYNNLLTNSISNTVFIWQKQFESYEQQTLPIQRTGPIITQLGQYRRKSANNDDITICFFSYPHKHSRLVLIDNSKIKLITNIVINQVISYCPSYGSSVCFIGPRPSASGQYSRPQTCNWASTKLLNNIIELSMWGRQGCAVQITLL